MGFDSTTMQRIAGKSAHPKGFSRRRAAEWSW
jgi:hypothetical protein